MAVAAVAADNHRRALGRPGKTHQGVYIPVGSGYGMLRRIEGGGGGCRLSTGRPWWGGRLKVGPLSWLVSREFGLLCLPALERYSAKT